MTNWYLINNNDLLGTIYFYNAKALGLSSTTLTVTAILKDGSTENLGQTTYDSS